MAANCSTGDTCPRMFETERGTVVIQGYVLEEGQVPEHAAAPAGEAQVEMPRETLLELARRLQAHEAPGPGRLLGEFKRSAFRLETLPQYLVDAEADAFRDFLQGRPVARRTAENSPWHRRIAESTRAGMRWHRVHLVSLPLTDYVRYEFQEYRANAAAGEDVRIVDLGAHPELGELREDFWLLDGDEPGAYVVLMRYDAEGRWLGAWRTDDPPVVERCREERDRALAASVPLAEFVVEVERLQGTAS
jgi:hypothetical protein